MARPDRPLFFIERWFSSLFHGMEDNLDNAKKLVLSFRRMYIQCHDVCAVVGSGRKSAEEKALR